MGIALRLLLSLSLVVLSGCGPARYDNKNAPQPPAQPQPAPQPTQPQVEAPAPPKIDEAQVPPTNAPFYDLATTSSAIFKWWTDPETKKVNFRRCDIVGDAMKCQPPMLLRGIDQKDIPVLLDFYAERLQQWGSTHLSQFVGILTGSLGTATAYVGTLAALKVFHDAMPERWEKIFKSLPIRSGIHLLSLGTIGLLIYFTADNLLHMYRQNRVWRKLEQANATRTRITPSVRFDSDALFEEFIATFRRALHEFTHGGPPFDERGNLIFQ